MLALKDPDRERYLWVSGAGAVVVVVSLVGRNSNALMVELRMRDPFLHSADR